MKVDFIMFFKVIWSSILLLFILFSIIKIIFLLFPWFSIHLTNNPQVCFDFFLWNFVFYVRAITVMRSNQYLNKIIVVQFSYSMSWKIFKWQVQLWYTLMHYRDFWPVFTALTTSGLLHTKIWTFFNTWTLKFYGFY